MRGGSCDFVVETTLLFRHSGRDHSCSKFGVPDSSPPGPR
jgi:hypothetical protein